MFQLIYRKYGQGIRWKDDLLSGLTVSLALVPEAVAFAFVAGVDPLVGLYAAFIVGVITAAFGGRPGMISGATGAMAVAMTAVVVMYGLEYLLAAVVLAGVIQIATGLLKLGRFIRILPHPVMLGFVNGLAIVIGLAQFGQFKTGHAVEFAEPSGHDAGGFRVVGDWLDFASSELWIIVGLIVATMAIIQWLPKLTRAVPAPLVAIVLGTVAVAFVPNFTTVTVGEVLDTQRLLQAETELKTKRFAEEEPNLLVKDVRAKGEELAALKLTKAEMETELGRDIKEGLKAGLPTLHIPQINWKDSAALKAILFLAVTLASIGLIESLMTLSLIDELTETRGSSDRECMGQGAANVVTGFFGGMGGCAMIGQSMININSGGRGRLSGISAALFLLGFILFTPGLIEMIPIASLVGVMFMVVIATFEWSSLRLIGKVPAADIIVIVLVSGVTVFMHNLALGVGVGIAASALVYAWEHAKELKLHLRKSTDTKRTYEIDGPLFFGSIQEFKELFNPAEDPDDVYLSFANTKVCDHSAIEAIHSMSVKYRALGKRLHLHDLAPDCSKLLEKAGDLVEGQYYGKVSGGH
ncbi:MAG: SulP family inorganic anion transporter [Akkermansiaceae bacterium]|jgi:SulP family sulfate permease|nr:SulP family inorganic anion transporter [Akkermansiaceae bacterium]